MRNQFDGDDNEFPHRKQAMHLYKMYWYSFVCSRDAAVREVLEANMASLQQEICYGPGPLWLSFVGTLPGYNTELEVTHGIEY